MNILLVDDEAITIEMLMSEIRWDRFSFAHIFTAGSLAEAREILAVNKVEILLCDIEMPMGSGLELLNWIREEKLPVECIFLTCHADFSYAREAMKLGGMEYILKPALRDEVEMAVQKAVCRQREISARNAQALSWQRNRILLFRQFWTDLLAGLIEPREAVIRDDLTDRGLALNQAHSFFPVLIVSAFPDFSRSEVSFRKSGRDCHKAAEAVFKASEVPFFSLFQSDASLLVIREFSYGETAGALADTENLCAKFLEDLTYEERPGIFCYLGEPCPITRLPDMVEELQTMSYQNVVLDHSVVTLRSYKPQEASVADTDLSGWQELLNQLEFLKVQKEITHYLNRPGTKKTMDPYFLRQFYLEYYQILVAFACGRQLILTDILDPKQCIDYSTEAVRSLKGMVSWVVYSTDTLNEYFRSTAGQSTPIQKVKQYISDHICENLSVMAIADYVHMNSSYLTRIFKKGTGYSIYHYIQKEKINLAKQKLASSSSIGEIALDLGYQSYVSFSRAFSKIAGMSPKEYKQQFMEGKSDEK